MVVGVRQWVRIVMIVLQHLTCHDHEVVRQCLAEVHTAAVDGVQGHLEVVDNSVSQLCWHCWVLCVVSHHPITMTYCGLTTPYCLNIHVRLQGNSQVQSNFVRGGTVLTSPHTSSFPLPSGVVQFAIACFGWGLAPKSALPFAYGPPSKSVSH